MVDEADSALMAAFKSVWKRTNTLQTKNIKLNEIPLTRGRRKKPEEQYVDYHGRIVADCFGLPAINVNDAIT